MLAGLERRRIRVEVECSERNGKRPRRVFGAGDVNGCGPRPKSIGGRTTRETGEDARTSAGWLATETWLESASPAETAAENFKSVCKDATRGAESISGEEDAASEGGITAVVTPASASRNGSEKNSRRQWSNEQGSAGGIGYEFVAIEKSDGHAGCQPPVYIEHGQCRALARNDAPRKQEDSRAGCRWRLLLWLRKRIKLCNHANNSKKQAEPKEAPQGHA